MISWRYHLVSIIAVFLALALGVLAGTAVVNQGLVHNLQSTTDRLTKETQDYRARISEITTENRNLTDFSDQTMNVIANLRLDQVDVVLVTDEGADPAAIGEARTALLAAGATVVTTLIPLPKVFSADPADQKLLANVIGAPAQTDPSLLPGLLAQTLAGRLAQGPPPQVRPGQQDVLGTLLSTGFIDSTEPGVRSAMDLGVPGAVVVVGGPTEGSSMPPAGFMVPLVQALSVQRMVVAAGEADAAPGGFVYLVRNDGAGEGPRVTVDDLQGSLGGTALVVGLQRGIEQGTGGDYGTASGQLLPPLS